MLTAHAPFPTVWALLSTEKGPAIPVPPGGIIGRLETAALRLNEPGISEAHAIVSLRGGALRLLALRGRVTVNAKQVKDVELAQGMSVGLGGSHSLQVVALSLPETVLALKCDDFERLVPPPVVSLSAADKPLVAGYLPTADAVLWSDSGTFRLRTRDGAERVLQAGDTFTVGARKWSVIAVPLRARDITPTTPGGRNFSPVRVIVRSDNVHIWCDDQVTPLDGMPGFIVGTLAQSRRSHAWQELASELWPDEDDLTHLRVLWDGALGRLRRRLKEAGIRPGLIRTDGVGHIELLLGPGDRIEVQ